MNILKNKNLKRVSAAVSNFYNLFNILSDANIIIDFDTKVIKYVNKKALILFGYKETELLDQSYTILIPENKRNIHNTFTKELEKDSIYHDKIMGLNRMVYGRHKIGHDLLIKIKLNTMYLNEKKHIIITIKNKTDKQNILDQLNNYKNMFDKNLDMICIASVDGYFVEVNDSFERILGYSKQELYDQTFLNFVYPKDIDATILHLKKLANGDEVVQFKNRYYTKNKKLRWLSWSAIPKSEFLVYAIARDITDEENKLRIVIDLENSMQSMEILANIGSWKWYINSDRLEWSEGTKKIFDTRDVSFENYGKVLYKEDYKHVMSTIETCISTKLNYEIYHRIQVNDEIKYVYGKGKYVEESVEGDYMIGIVQDITDQIEAKQIILKYKDMGLSVENNIGSL